MENQKHTPQPWHLDTYGEYQCISVDPVTPGDNGGISLAEFYGPDREANADLFMRAPELQAEIERLKQTLTGIKNWALVGPLMSEQGGQLLAICKLAKDALDGATPSGLQKEIAYLRAEIQRMQREANLAAGALAIMREQRNEAIDGRGPVAIALEDLVDAIFKFGVSFDLYPQFNQAVENAQKALADE